MYERVRWLAMHERFRVPILVKHFCRRDEIVGAATLLRFVGRVSPLAGFYGSSPLLSAQVKPSFPF